MAIPNWLVQAAGAMKFADPARNGGLPTMGDVAQGIGHSMMNHYRNGQGAPPAGTPGAAPAPAPMLQTIQPPMTLGQPDVPLGQVKMPALNFTNPLLTGMAPKTMGLISDLFK